MATVLRNFTSPALLPPPVNLELSLGGLLSDQHHPSSEILAPAQTKITGADCKEAVARPGSCSIGKPENGADGRINTLSPALSCNTINQPADVNSKGLQVQRWHAARKRRKGIIEEKLHKRLFKGEGAPAMYSSSMSRPFNGARGTEWEGSDSYAPKSEHDTGNGDMFFLQSFRFGVPSAAAEQSTVAGHGMPSEVMHDISCDDKHLQKGQCVRPLGHTPRTLPLYGPQLVHYPTVANIPTAASSSSLCTAAFPERRCETSGSIKGDDEDNQMGCRCSSSSGLENECSVRDMQSITSSDMEAQSSSCDGKSGHTGAVYKSTTEEVLGNSAGYPYILPAMPLASPYAIPLQWGLSPPWFMQYPPHMAFGGNSVPAPLMAVPLNEVTSLLPVSPRNPHHLPLHNDKASNSWCPSVSVVETSTTSENVTSKPSVDTGRQDPVLTGHIQAEKAQIDAMAPPMQSHREKETSAIEAMTVDDQGSTLVEDISKFNRNEGAAVKAKGVQKLGNDQRVFNSSGGGCYGERASSGEQVDRGRRHSVPPACKRASKKAKVVRFNSLDSVMQVAQPELNSNDQSSSDDVPEIAGSLTHSVSADHSQSLHVNVDHSRSHSNCASCVAELHSEVDHHPCDGTSCKALDECTSVNHSDDNEMSYDSSEFNSENGHMHAGGFLEKQGLDRTFADLPTVKTRGLGPNGKTIYGVMYITKNKQARLICRCHGNCMSPVEFVQHSGSNDLSYPERNILLSSLPSASQVVSRPPAAKARCLQTDQTHTR